MTIAEPQIGTVIDVAVVASSPLILGGLQQALGGSEGIRVTHRVHSISWLPRATPDTVVVVDLYGVPADDKRFYSRAPEGAPIVALCVPESPPGLVTALQGGVHALVSRESNTDELLLAVHTARRGGLYVAPNLLRGLVDTTRGDDRGPHELTPREAEALRYLAEGFTHGQISRRMGLAETTVNTYVKRIRHKLNAGNKAELTRRAMELGYLKS